jgi:hypothetical protein
LRENDEERSDGIVNGGRRYFADFQPADEAIAEPPRATWSEAIADQAATEVVAVTAVAINAGGSADNERILICRNRTS